MKSFFDYQAKYRHHATFTFIAFSSRASILTEIMKLRRDTL